MLLRFRLRSQISGCSQRSSGRSCRLHELTPSDSGFPHGMPPYKLKGEYRTSRFGLATENMRGVKGWPSKDGSQTPQHGCRISINATRSAGLQRNSPTASPFYFSEEISADWPSSWDEASEKDCSSAGGGGKTMRRNGGATRVVTMLISRTIE